MSKQIKVSESVCAGHPDKLADQISDAILDEALRQDKNARVAAEVLVARNTIVLAGELNTTAKLNFKDITRSVIKENGYIRPEWGFSYKSKIINRLHHQSAEIAVGVDDFGAGDQGLMYGYATDETSNLMPLPVSIAHKICKTLDEARAEGGLSYLRPDGKSQVVVEYYGEQAVGVKHITLAVPHDENISLEQVKKDIINKILSPVLGGYGFLLPTAIVVNGTGVWHQPGPAIDVGLTGRKIVVDTYGGASRVGGGAFSGKDPSKVDRSGAYAARYIAKNIVARGLAKRAEVCLAYYIGAKQPIIQTIETFGTRKVGQSALDSFAKRLLGTSVREITQQLSLRRPIYRQTSVYGHFGKENLPWECINKNVKI